METKELKITIPEGQEIDWQESAKQEKIVFKKKDTKPRSWEEYCCQQQTNCKKGYCINSVTSEIQEINWGLCTCSWKSVLPSEKLTEAFLAMMQLVSLRQAWIGDWKPDWKDTTSKWSIVYEKCKLGVYHLYSVSHPLTFPTNEMAEDFMNTFKDLLEVAKPLI